MTVPFWQFENALLSQAGLPCCLTPGVAARGCISHSFLLKTWYSKVQQKMKFSGYHGGE